MKRIHRNTDITHYEQYTVLLEVTFLRKNVSNNGAFYTLGKLYTTRSSLALFVLILTQDLSCLDWS